MFVMKKVAQHKAGKDLVKEKKAEFDKVHLKSSTDWQEASAKGSGPEYMKDNPEPKIEERYDPDRITNFSWRTYTDVFKEEMEEQRKVVALKLFEKAVNSEGNDEMEQIVTTVGFVIDKIKKTPTSSQIYKRLQG